MSVNTKIRLAIVGAGISGLVASKEIAKKLGDKILITIFEARNRVGGRVYDYSVDNLNLTLDLGPNWLHGTNEKYNSSVNYYKKVYDFNKENELLSIKGSAFTIDRNGKVLSKVKVKELENLMWKYIDKAFEYSNNNENISSSSSLLDYVDLCNLKDRNTDDNYSLIKDEISSFGNYSAMDVKNQSLKFLNLEDTCPGETLFVSSSHKKLLNQIYKEVVKTGQVDIHLNSKVTTINTSFENSNVCILYEKNNNANINNTYTQLFDAVIVAVPLGSLKRTQIDFIPQIPKKIRNSIKNIGYGNLEKLYIVFNERFWDSNHIKFHPASYFKFLNNQNKNVRAGPLDILSLSHISKNVTVPVLQIYTSGSTSEYIQNLIDERSSYNSTWTPKLSSSNFIKMKTFLEPFISKLPGYDIKKHYITDIFATKWSKDPLAGYGSYPNFPVGIENAYQDLENIRNGIPERNIWFTGDYTGTRYTLSTIAGAYTGAENVASLFTSFIYK